MTIIEETTAVENLGSWRHSMALSINHSLQLAIARVGWASTPTKEKPEIPHFEQRHP